VVTRERDRLREERGVDPVRLLDAAAGALRARPPEGVDGAYVEGFLVRNRGTLLGIVRGAFVP